MRGEGGERHVKARKTILQKKGRKLRRYGKKKQRIVKDKWRIDLVSLVHNMLKYNRVSVSFISARENVN